MKNFELSLLLIPFVTALAFFLPFAGLQSSQNTTASSEPSAQAADGTQPSAGKTPAETPTGVQSLPPLDQQSNAAQMIYQFLGVDSEICRKNPGGGIYEIQKEYKLEFLVATLPDPVESQLSYLFDRNLDAVQRAIESDDYVLDRFDFPWQEQNGDSQGGNNSDNKANQSKAEKTERVQRPGVILFRSRTLQTTKTCPSGRKIPYAGRLLVLFIIGETPTSGVNKAALKNAFDQIALLSRWRENNASPELLCLPDTMKESCESPITNLCWEPNPGDPPKYEIRVMGPTFSGSGDSLELTIQSWLEAVKGDFDPPIFSVISGSATSISQCRFCRRIKTHGQPVFHSTTPPSHLVVEAFTRYLVKMDPKAADRKIAILQEANTAYGRSSIQETLQDIPKKQVRERRGSDPQVCPDQKMKSEDQLRNEGMPGGKLLTLPYPLHISQLRSASEKARVSKTGSSLPLPDIRRPLLPLLIADDQKTNDVVPLFSQLEPASIELVLAELLEELNREQIRHMGIISTDVKDCIFLAGQIRRHCPNTTIFIFLADILYIRPEAKLDLQGALVVTPYPLFGPNQFWSYPVSATHTRFQFPAHATQGAYNATLALMGRSDLLEYGDPFDQPNDTNRRKPALWVTAVGRDGFLPVRILDYERLLDLSEERSEERIDRYPLSLSRATTEPVRPILNVAGGLNSKTSTTVVLFLIAIGLVIPFATLTQLLGTKWPRFIEKFQPARHLSQSWLGELFGDSVFDGYKMTRRFYQMVCCVSLLTVYLPTIWVFLLPYWVHWQVPNLEPDRRNSFLAVVFLIGLVTAISLISALWLFGSLADSWWRKLVEKKKNPTAVSITSDLTKREQTTLQDQRKDEDAQSKTKMNPVFPAAIFFGLITLAATIMVGYQFMKIPETSRLFFFFVRATNLTCGVSPLLPIMLTGAAALLSAICSLRRWNLVELIHPVRHWELGLDYEDLPRTDSFLNFEKKPESENSKRADDPMRGSSWAGVREMERGVTKLFDCSPFQLPAWLLVTTLMTISALYVLVYRFIPTVESYWFDLFVRAVLFITSLALAIAILRFICIWFALRRLLRRLSGHPLFANADEKKYAELPKITVTSPAPSYPSISFSVSHAVTLCQMMKRCPDDLFVMVNKAEGNLRELLEAKARNDWHTVVRKRCETQVRLADISLKVAQLREPGLNLFNGSSPPLIIDTEGIKYAKIFLAGRVVAFLHYALAHLQNLAIFVTGGMLLLLLAITSYPFQPRDLLLLFGWLMILTVVATTLFVFVQMNRDKVLSILSGGDPARLTWIFRVAIHGLLPILTLLSIEFPEALQQMFSWLSALQGGGR